MATTLSTTKLLPKTKKKLRKLSDITGEKMYRLMDRLVDEEEKKLKIS